MQLRMRILRRPREELSEADSEASEARKILAAEEAHLSGFFLRVVNFHDTGCAELVKSRAGSSSSAWC